MILVDTCGWIEWLTDGNLADQYEPCFEDVTQSIVPTSVQFELYKWVARKEGEQRALEAVALTEQALVVPLSTSIALLAATSQRRTNSHLPMPSFTQQPAFIRRN